MPSDLAHEPSATRVWEAVSERLEAFARAWGAGPPDLAAFVPPGPPNVRRLTLVEVIKYDLEQRLQRGGDRPVESYLADFPELTAGGAPCDLLYEDYHLRKQAGHAVSAADYLRRFPDRAAELGRLIGGTSPALSTSVFGRRPRTPARPGDRLDDFELLTLLGEGQFAQVFLARQVGMQRLVALKLSAHRGSEAQTLAQLDHPHIVRVFDQRVLPDRELQLVYMPYLPGGTLADVLAHARAGPAAGRSGATLLAAVDASLVRRGEAPPPGSPARAGWASRTWPATVCAIGAKLAAALDYAHQHGVLHRDVKPANILLTAEGEPLLADFNIGCCSKVDGAGPSAFFGGTLPYMAPEHIEAFNPEHDRPPESLDGRADVFSLAVTVWELLTGKNPFGVEYLHGSWPETLDALAARRRMGPPADAVAEVDEAGTPGLKDVLLRCLAADPGARPATAGEMARELELCLKPATRALVRPGPGGWRETVRRFPIPAVFGVTLVPNLLASIFNIEYNREAIIDPWGVKMETFRVVMLVVNNVFFPLGLLALGCVLWPVAAGLGRLRAGQPLDPGKREGLRLRALRLGRATALVCVTCWLVASAVWIVTLRLISGPPPETALYLHFLGSFVVCGLIAATYPYFLVTYLAVRVMYPALLGPGGPGPGDEPALQRVERELGRYRVLAAAIPLAAIGLLGSLGVHNSFAVGVLSLTGVAGTLTAFVLEGRIRGDLAALAEVPGTRTPVG